ncbi:hypothetical protein NWO25_15995 [Enterococcus lactis]|nr:hypothetical protein [Enterococcus lactis]
MGKSTLAQLLAGFYVPDSGKICINEKILKILIEKTYVN